MARTPHRVRFLSVRFTAAEWTKLQARLRKDGDPSVSRLIRRVLFGRRREQITIGRLFQGRRRVTST